MQHVATTYPALLHCNNSVISPRFDVKTVARMVHETNTPWLSVHLGFPVERLNALWQRFAIPVPLISRAVAYRLAVHNIKALQKACAVPVAIENQAHYRRNGHAFLVEPAFIEQVVRQTEVGLLLDVGHAVVSATMTGISVERYIAQLPTDKIVELHVHRPGIRGGHLRDMHLPLETEDYQRIAQLLQTLPRLRAVTLEYYGPADVLREQLQHLRQLIALHHAPHHSAVPNTESS